MLAILAATAVLIVPVTSGPRRGDGVQALAQAIVADLRTARAAALRSAVEHSVIVDTGGRRITLEPSGTARTIPASMALSATTAVAEQVAAGTVRIRFFADGGSTGGHLDLAEGRVAAHIEIDWLTGDARVAAGR